MCTVVVSTLGSGTATTRRPFARRYSVTPSTVATFWGAASAAQASAKKRSGAASSRPRIVLMPVIATAPARRRSLPSLFLRAVRAAVVADAGLQVVAFLALARLAYLATSLGALLQVGLALGRILGLRAEALLH